MSGIRKALIALAASALVLGSIAGASSASADVDVLTSDAPGWAGDAPNGFAAWPTCVDDAAQYCIESATIDSVPASASVSILPGPPESGPPWSAPQSINWAFNSLYNSAGDLSQLDSTAQITIRLGTFVPRYTTAYARNFTLTTSEASGNHKMVITGKPMHAFWNRDAGTPCSIGSCGGDMAATQDIVAFSGNTQNMSTWGDDAITQFSGMYIATNAQSFAPTVTFSTAAIPPNIVGVPHWEFQVASPHFETDGTTLATGNFEAFLPANYFAYIHETPSDSEFSVTRLDSGVPTTVSGVTTPLAGGAKLTIASLHYSDPLLAVKSVPVAHPPTAPRNLTVTGVKAQPRVIRWAAPASNGGAPVTGYRLVVTRIYTVPVRKKVGKRWVTVNQTKTATVINQIQTARAATLNPLTGYYRATVAARNSAGQSAAVAQAFRGKY